MEQERVRLFKAILGLVKARFRSDYTIFGKEPQQLTREDKEKIGVAFDKCRIQ